MKPFGTGAKILFYLAICLLVVSCRSTSTQQDGANILSLETSAALDETCRRGSVSATTDELDEAENSLAKCIGSIDIVKKWSKNISDRMKGRWPQDFVARGQGAVTCLEELTRGAQTRYLEALQQACLDGDTGRKRELLAVLSQEQDEPCFDMVNMTVDGCFVVQSCDGKLIDPKTFGIFGSQPQKVITICSERIQKIHRIKDPMRGNLLYNYSYVSELTGNQSSNRITYGPPNCHGVAQAAAGGFLNNLRLETVQHARLANQSRCEAAVTKFFTAHKHLAISEIPMNPGGVMVNMKYAGCSSNDCGRVALWVDDCRAESLDLSVFVDDMCVECWEKKLVDGGLKRQPNYFSGKQLIAGCILTMQDHSIMIVGRSRGMCFFYEATSPYGPPQIRAVPCPVLNQKFQRQYCPAEPTAEWRLH